MSEIFDFLQAQTYLQAVGALVLPREKTVRSAGIGKVWSGRTADGKLWTLTKKDVDSFVCT